MQIQWGTGGQDPLENCRAIGFLSNTGPYPLEYHKATKPAFNVGPLSDRLKKHHLMAFRWRANDSSPLVVFQSSLPTSAKKTLSECQFSWTPPFDKLLWICDVIYLMKYQPNVHLKPRYTCLHCLNEGCILF